MMMCSFPTVYAKMVSCVMIHSSYFLANQIWFTLKRTMVTKATYAKNQSFYLLAILLPVLSLPSLYIYNFD